MCRTGCSVGNSLINHLMYADDLVIFSPSSIGLRALITVCEAYAVSHEMVFNHKKSVILICRSKYMKNVYPVFTLNGKIIDESDTVRYLGHILLYNTLFSREEIFAKSEFEIFSREDIFANILFTRKYLPAKISSRENIFSRKYLPAKISSRELFLCRKYAG